jgi:hypothetical protein
MNTIRDSVVCDIDGYVMRLLVSKLNSYLDAEAYWCVHARACMPVYNSMPVSLQETLENTIRRHDIFR